MHGRLATLRSVSRRATFKPSASEVERRAQQRGGGATLGAPAAAPVRGRGACGDEQSTPTGDWTAPGHPPGRPAAGGRSAADGGGAAAPGERIAITAAYSVALPDLAPNRPQECGAVAGIGGSCAQNRESCAPLFRLRRRAVRRQRTRRVPAPARPARQRRHGSHPPRRRPRTAAPKERRAQPMERHRRGRRLTVQRTRLMERHLRWSRLTVQRALTDSVEQRWPT